MNDEERKQVVQLRINHKYNDNPTVDGLGCTFCFLLAIIERQEKEIARLKGQCDCESTYVYFLRRY